MWVGHPQKQLFVASELVMAFELQDEEEVYAAVGGNSAQFCEG
jgi:hypothetical protein